MYRVSRLLRRLGVLIVVCLIVYTLLVAISGADWFREAKGDLNYSKGQLALAGEDVDYTTQVNLTDPTYFALTNLELAAHISYANGVPIVKVNPGPVTINGGTTGSVLIVAQIPVTATAAAEALLTNDEVLPGIVWLNATYATLFAFQAQVYNNISWGAPFYDLQASVGNPVLLPNGTAQATVTVTFNNHAEFADEGTLVFVVESSGGQTCSHGSLGINVPAGSGYDQGTAVDLVSGCSPVPNGSFQAVYEGSGFSIPLPAEAIP